MMMEMVEHTLTILWYKHRKAFKVFFDLFPVLCTQRLRFLLYRSDTTFVSDLFQQYLASSKLFSSTSVVQKYLKPI